MTSFATFADWKTYVLDLAQSAVDGTDDFDATATRQLDRAYQEVLNTGPFLFLRVNPPQAFVTTAPITAGTVSVTQGSAALTFSSAPIASVQNQEIIIAGDASAYRIASHVAGQAAATLDVAFQGATNAAATYTVFQREYDLPTTPRHIESMVTAAEGAIIDQKEELEMRRLSPDPPRSGWPPQWFARIGEGRIRLDVYPSKASRIEVAYTQIAADPSGASVTILIPAPFRYVVCDGATFLVMLAKNDTRADAFGILFANGKAELLADDARKRGTLGAPKPRRGAYA